MGMTGGGPNVPGPNLADVGKGRFFSSSRTAVLERFDGAVWREVGRYGWVRVAGTALAAAVGAGPDPGTLRVVERGMSTGSRVLLVLGAVLLIGAFVFAMYALLG
jgi:uncharacterized membrane protein YraQ (UPF0718 family)